MSGERFRRTHRLISAPESVALAEFRGRSGSLMGVQQPLPVPTTVGYQSECFVVGEVGAQPRGYSLTASGHVSAKSRKDHKQLWVVATIEVPSVACRRLHEVAVLRRVDLEKA